MSEPTDISVSQTESEDGTPSPASDLFRRIAMLSSSATLAHLLLFAVSPILSRIYDAGDFATFAFYQSSLSILSLLLTLQFEQAITIPKEQGDADAVRRLALRMAFGLAVVLGACSFALYASGFLTGLWLAPLVVCLLPFCSLAEAYARTFRVDAVRAAGFRRMSLSRVLLSMGTGVGQITCFLIGLKSIGLVLGDGLGRWISVIPFIWKRQSASDSVVVVPIQTHRVAQTRSLIHRFMRFPLFLTPAAILALLVNVAPSLILPGLYGEEFAGQFALANRSVLLPLLIISQAVTHVYVSDASRMVREQDHSLVNLLRRTAVQLACVGGILAASAAILGWLLFTTIFGAKWAVSGTLVPLLALGGFAQFVGGPLNQVLILVQEEKRKFAMNTIGVVAIGGVLWGSAAMGLTGFQATACYACTILLVQSLYVSQSFVVAHQNVAKWQESPPQEVSTALAA